MADDIKITIKSDVDVVDARRRGRELAAQLDFSAGDQAVVAAAISEVARNILSYAGHGEVLLHVMEDAERPGIRIVARDRGPGIADIARAMRDGYSTSGGLGLGLPGARRLMDEFQIVSSPKRGTTVTMKVWRRRRG
ncbi:MAG TPA: anti-sigma regulatory factor [Gemmatimonadaceae bacterium]